MPRLPQPVNTAFGQPNRVASVAMLVLVLLWAQTWGQWHSVLHARHAVAGVVQAPAHGLAPLGLDTAAEHSVFDHAAGDDQCRLLDQLSHADSLPCVPLLALPVGFSAALVAQSVGLAVARWSALFQARAPPFYR